jgi:hypothetical protein
LQTIGEVLGRGAGLQANDGNLKFKGIQIGDDVGDL